MVIDLNKCATEPLRIERRFDVGSVFASYPELERLSELDVALDVRAAGAENFIVRGSVRTVMQPFCVRCSESFTLQLTRDFDLLFLPESERQAEDSEDANVAFYRPNGQLEVLPILEEQVNLAFPMRFLCEPECSGLCSQCGGNRNRTKCDCAAGSGSPFEALRELLH